MKSIPRRTFLKAGAAATAGSFVLPRFSIGKPGPSANSKLNIAMIGAGGIAGMAFNGCRGENFVATCDVDVTKLHEHARRNPDIALARDFQDFRVMLDKMHKEIDAVVINTPDHTHFVATLAAMERGLHVLTQKPLTHNIWQARTLRKAKEKYKVVTNMGNQGHTYDGIREMREWIEADVFGQITEVHSWTNGPGKNWKGLFRKPDSFPPSEDPVPATLDWDLWLGPVPYTPFHKNYCPLTWRGFNAFGTGQFGDWFCHIADGPVWLLDLYEPVAVEAEQVEGGNEWMTPDGNRIRWEFRERGSRKPCTFYWHNGDPHFVPATPENWTWGERLPARGGSLLKGEKNSGFLDERSNNPRLINRDEMKAFKEGGLPEAKYPRVPGGPFQEWIQAIKGTGPEPGANFDYAARLTEVMLIGALAVRHGGRIEWDAKEMKITNRPELNQYLKEPVREGWSYGEGLWQG